MKNANQLDLNHLNTDRKTVYEAYASNEIELVTGTCTGTMYDPAA